MATAARPRLGELRAIMDDEMLATDADELTRVLAQHLRDPVVAEVVAGAYVNRVRLLLRAQADNAAMQDRMREALGKIEGLEKKMLKMRRENPKPLAVYLTTTAPGHALVGTRGAVEPMEMTPELAQQLPAPGTLCLVNDEGFLATPTMLVQAQSPGVVRAPEDGGVTVEVNGRQLSAVANAQLDGTLAAGDKVRVLETSGLAMVTGRRAEAAADALNRYPQVMPWEGGFAGAAPLRPDLRAAAMRCMVLPVKSPDEARQLKAKLPPLVLFCGPSRTGKTVCLRCIVGELNVPAFSLSISSIGSEYVSVTPRQLREAVEYGLRLSAEKKQPVLMALDDGEQLARQRGSLPNSCGWHDDVVGELLAIIDYLDHRTGPGQVCLALLTNREDLLDTAVVKRGHQQLRFSLPGPAEYAAIWRYELDRLERAARPAEPEAAVERLTADVFTDSGWVNEMLGEAALRLVAPAQLIDCAVPRRALSEARGVALERAVRDGRVSPLACDELRSCQKKILVDAYRLAVKRAGGGRFSDLNLLALRPRGE